MKLRRHGNRYIIINKKNTLAKVMHAIKSSTVKEHVKAKFKVANGPGAKSKRQMPE